MCEYESIVKFNVQQEWDKLSWEKLPIDKNKQHFEWAELENRPGLYRVKLEKAILEPKDFSIGSGPVIHVKKFSRNTVLSIGKTTNLKERLSKQHFTSNRSGNRLGRHLVTIFGKNEKDYYNLTDLFHLVKKGAISIQYVIVETWWKRDLLESYGKVAEKCIFDIGIEH